MICVVPLLAVLAFVLLHTNRAPTPIDSVVGRSKSMLPQSCVLENSTQIDSTNGTAPLHDRIAALSEALVESKAQKRCTLLVYSPAYTSFNDATEYDPSTTKFVLLDMHATERNSTV